MRTLTVVLTLAIFGGCSPPAAQSPTPAPSRTAKIDHVKQGCGDLLQRLGRKPDTVRYVGCESFPHEQGAPVRATYELKGQDAAAAEAYLIRTFQMKPLKRVCCAWDNPSKGFNDQGTSFTVGMASEETTVAERRDWNKVAKFRVIVEMLTEEV